MTTPTVHSSAAPAPGARTRTPVVGLTLAALTLAGCASSPNHPTGVIAITVKPGDTGSCETTPCQVRLVMPPGQGTYEVTGNEVRVGTFPAGQTVNLGGYWTSQRFAVVGAGVPPAYVYVPSDL